jgi:hypothetical protein
VTTVLTAEVIIWLEMLALAAVLGIAYLVVRRFAGRARQ